MICYLKAIIVDMPQERTYTDQCPEPIMGFQDLGQYTL